MTIKEMTKGQNDMENEFWAKCGIPCFGGEEDGDCFDQADFNKMVNERLLPKSGLNV